MPAYILYSNQKIICEVIAGREERYTFLFHGTFNAGSGLFVVPGNAQDETAGQEDLECSDAVYWAPYYIKSEMLSTLHILMEYSHLYSL